MNKEEILNKYIDLIDKGYCRDCNELNCIDNFPYAKITHAIKELQQENKQLKDNWNKLKEYLKETVDSDCYCPYDGYDWQDILNKMQELEGDDE